MVPWSKRLNTDKKGSMEECPKWCFGSLCSFLLQSVGIFACALIWSQTTSLQGVFCFRSWFSLPNTVLTPPGAISFVSISYKFLQRLTVQKQRPILAFLSWKWREIQRGKDTEWCSLTKYEFTGSNLGTLEQKRIKWSKTSLIVKPSQAFPSLTD